MTNVETDVSSNLVPEAKREDANEVGSFGWILDLAAIVLGSGSMAKPSSSR